MKLIRSPIGIVALVISTALLTFSIIISTTIQMTPIVFVRTSLMAQASSCILFPILVGYFYDKIKEREDGEAIWRVFQEFSEGGILRVYKDRENNINPDNASIHLRQAFEKHLSGEVRIIGVSLRVFFHPAGEYYGVVRQVATRSKINKTNIKMKVLVLDVRSHEFENRLAIESMGTPEPLIEKEIELSIRTLKHLTGTAVDRGRTNHVEYGTYSSAPYCTLVLFPDKCFYSPNILSSSAPVRLPMIVFRKDSTSYHLLSEYFDYVWGNRIESTAEITDIQQ